MWPFRTAESAKTLEPEVPVDRVVEAAARRRALQAEGTELNREWLQLRAKYRLVVDPIGRIRSCECDSPGGKAVVAAEVSALFRRSQKWVTAWNAVQAAENEARRLRSLEAA